MIKLKLMKQKRVQDILTFLGRCKALETTKRYEASMSKNRNTVAEHSWHLALMVLIVAKEAEVNINIEKALTIALLHDIAESKTGDFDAYTQIKLGTELKNKKNIMEESVIKNMTEDISFGNWIYDFWKEYEEQKSVEAKFVKALDKIEGFLHISEVGVEAYIPKEFHSNYADEAVDAFNETAHHFPELNGLLQKIKMDLKKQFKQVGVKWIDNEKQNK